MGAGLLGYGLIDTCRLIISSSYWWFSATDAAWHASVLVNYSIVHFMSPYGQTFQIPINKQSRLWKIWVPDWPLLGYHLVIWWHWLLWGYLFLGTRLCRSLVPAPWTAYKGIKGGCQPALWCSDWHTLEHDIVVWCYWIAWLVFWCNPVVLSNCFLFSRFGTICKGHNHIQVCVVLWKSTNVFLFRNNWGLNQEPSFWEKPRTIFNNNNNNNRM